MNSDRPVIKSQSTSVIPTPWVIVIALVAFAAGAGISWLVLSGQQTTSVQSPPTYITKAPASMAEPVPPDVSQMSPSQSAVTLGNWNYDRKAWQKAVDSYQHAIFLGMDNADIRTDLGNALRFSGQPQKALEQYQTARREDPQHENSLCNLATLYAQVLSDPVNATATWREYLRLFPNGEKASVARQFIAAESLKAP